MKKKYCALDIFKGIIIFAGVILHAKDTFRASVSWFELLYNWGGFIVNTFFFTVSGFGIYRAYSSRVAKGSEPFFSFIWKRIVKIYPMYFITEFIMFLFTYHADGKSVFNVQEILLNVFMMTTGWFKKVVTYNGQCWFISVLFLMYILFWIIEKLFKGSDKYVYIILTVVGCLLMRTPLNKPFCYYDDGIGLACFSVGCLIAVFYEEFISHKSETVVLTLVLVLIAVCTYLFTVRIGFVTGTITSEYAFVFLIAPGLLLLALNPVVNSLFDKISIIKNTFGIISMTVFFWHLIILRVYNAICLKLSIYDKIGFDVAYIIYLIITFVACYAITKIVGNRKAKL